VESTTRQAATHVGLRYQHDAYKSAVSAEMIAYDSLIVVTPGRQSGNDIRSLSLVGTEHWPISAHVEVGQAESVMEIRYASSRTTLI